MSKLTIGIMMLFFCSASAQVTPAEGMSKWLITAAENTGYGPNLHGDVQIPFLLFTPPDAKKTLSGTGFLNKKYPIIIHHHGIGERTDTYTTPGSVNIGELDDLYATGPPPYLRTSTSVLYNRRFAAPGKTDSTQFFWLFPQVYGGYNYTFLVYTSETIKWIKRNLYHIVDTNRIYVAGLSFGGGGTWVAIQDSLLNMQIAAAVPIAPGYITYSGLKLTGTPGNASNYNFGIVARSRIPIYGVHSINDSTTDRDPVTKEGSYYSNRAFDSVAKYKAGGSWIYRKRTTGGHNVWDATWNPLTQTTQYSLTNGQTYNYVPPVLSWLLQWSTKGRRHN